MKFHLKNLTFSFKKKRLKVSSVKLRPFCLGLDVLKQCPCYGWSGLSMHDAKRRKENHFEKQSTFNDTFSNIVCVNKVITF